MRSDFRHVRGTLAGARSARPRLRFTAEYAEAASGGSATLRLKRFVRCARHRFVAKAVGTIAAASTPAAGSRSGSAASARPGYYLGRLTFAGTPRYRAGIDPVAALLQVDPDGTLDWVPPEAFPAC